MNAPKSLMLTHLAGVDLADLDFFGEPLDLLAGRLGALACRRGDEDRAVVLDVDVGAGLVLDAS